MVAFLASPAGDWITGAIFVVDGGEWLAKPRG
jgi:peroxisomal 2,4-dienoyl-CoA reductase